MQWWKSKKDQLIEKQQEVIKLQEKCIELLNSRAPEVVVRFAEPDPDPLLGVEPVNAWVN